MLALTRDAPCQQRRHDGVAGIQSCREVRHSDSHLDRRPVAGARQMRQPEFRLDHDVEPRPVAVRPGLAVSGDARVNETGVNVS